MKKILIIFTIFTLLILPNAFSGRANAATIPAVCQNFKLDSLIADFKDSIRQEHELYHKDSQLKLGDDAYIIGDLETVAKVQKYWTTPPWNNPEYGQQYYDSWFGSVQLQKDRQVKILNDIKTCFPGTNTSDLEKQHSSSLFDGLKFFFSKFTSKFIPILKIFSDSESSFIDKLSTLKESMDKFDEYTNGLKIKFKDMTSLGMSTALSIFAKNNLYTENIGLTEKEREECSNSFGDLATARWSEEKNAEFLAKTSKEVGKEAFTQAKCIYKPINYAIGTVDNTSSQSSSSSNSSGSTYIITDSTINTMNQFDTTTQMNQFVPYTIIEKKLMTATLLKVKSPVAFLPKGTEVPIDAKNTSVTPIVASGNVYVPGPFIVSKLGGTSSYNTKTKQLTITYQGKKTILTVGSKTMTINGKKYTLSTAVTYNFGNVYLSLQAVSTIFGKKVTYYNGLIWITSATTSLTSSEVNTLLTLFN